jgi:hypothetical protein
MYPELSAEERAQFEQEYEAWLDSLELQDSRAQMVRDIWFENNYFFDEETA